MTLKTRILREFYGYGVLGCKCPYAETVNYNIKYIQKILTDKDHEFVDTEVFDVFLEFSDQNRSQRILYCKLNTRDSVDLILQSGKKVQLLADSINHDTGKVHGSLIGELTREPNKLIECLEIPNK